MADLKPALSGKIINRTRAVLVVAGLMEGSSLGACQKHDDNATASANAAQTAGTAARDAAAAANSAQQSAGDASSSAQTAQPPS